MQWIIDNKEWLFSGIIVVVAGALISVAKSWYGNRIRVNVLMHRAFWNRSPMPYFFIKVTNLSKGRDIEVTHAWLETNPKAHILRPERPLPVRLRPLEIWETWIEESSVPKESRDRPYKLGRIRLSGGETIRSRKNVSVPEVGRVAGEWQEKR